MFGLGQTELVIILVLVVLVFGAKRIPELGKGIGEGIRSLTRAMQGKDELPSPSTAVQNEKNNTSST